MLYGFTVSHLRWKVCDEQNCVSKQLCPLQPFLIISNYEKQLLQQRRKKGGRRARGKDQSNITKRHLHFCMKCDGLYTLFN